MDLVTIVCAYNVSYRTLAKKIGWLVGWLVFVSSCLHQYTLLTASVPGQPGNLSPECQTIVRFTAATD